MQKNPIRNFLGTNAEQVKGWRVAVATGSDDAYGVARMLELTAQARGVPLRIQSFRSYEEA